jgi:hypothetical protein
MSAGAQAFDLAAEWNEARLLYPLYAALAREFVIDVPPCTDLEMGVETPPKESVEQARMWFREVDGKIQVHQLRQFLQTTTLTSQESLQVLLQHHLRKRQKSASDRDKTDFLLVQFFSHCVPSGVDETELDLGYVAQILEPVVGKVELQLPEWMARLQPIIQSAKECKRLSDLLHSAVLEQGRKLKVQCGDKYFQPVVMVAFARFSFLMRRVFFHLMHGDLDAILEGLRELERRGISTLDCRRAQFSAEEPIMRLRMICQSWKVMFHAEYSSGQPLRMLVDLRAAIEDALGASQGVAAGEASHATKKVAAAASAGAGKANSTATKPSAAKPSQEFDVTAGTSD